MSIYCLHGDFCVFREGKVEDLAGVVVKGGHKKVV